MNRATPAPVHDSTLVSQVQQGDPEAFSAIVRNYSNALTALASSRLRNPEDARDVVQEAFVIAYCTLSKLEQKESLGAWLRGITINCCNKQIDRRERFQRYIARLPHPSIPRDPHQVVSEWEQASELHQALEQLSATQREVVALFYFQNASVNEIAGLIQRPAGTVKRLLSEVRAKLKEELIEMARNEYAEYHLTEEQRNRFERIPQFPHSEPKITTARSDERALPTTMLAPYGNFPKLEPNAEGFYADYDHPTRSLTSLSHVTVQGPLQVENHSALRYDSLSFSKDGRAEGIWRPYYSLLGTNILYCAKQYGESEANLEVITPSHPNWGEPVPAPESLVLIPGDHRLPANDRPGFEVDTHFWNVQIGRTTHQCIRRVTGGDEVDCAWSETPLGNVATEEFILPDGRLLLWRRYNGASWSMQNPKRSSETGSFESLEKAGTARLVLFGHPYRLWYDQIPDYALPL